MELRKICEDTSDMGMWELAHNFVFIKDKEAWYRDFEREISALNLMREIIGKHGDPERISGLSDQELNDTLMDDLQYGTDDLDGVFATLYMALWGMAEVRGWLKQHEESGLPAIKRPEALQEAVAAYGTHAQVDMAIEEMSELTKALCKERRCGLGQGSRAQAHANIITFILQSEPGTSLRAAGWEMEAAKAGRPKWNAERYADRPVQLTLFPKKQPPEEYKQRWAKRLRPPKEESHV